MWKLIADVIGLTLALGIILMLAMVFLNGCAAPASTAHLTLGKGCTPPPQTINGPALQRCEGGDKPGTASCLYSADYFEAGTTDGYSCRYIMMRMECTGDWLLAGAVCQETAKEPVPETL